MIEEILCNEMFLFLRCSKFIRRMRILDLARYVPRNEHENSLNLIKYLVTKPNNRTHYEKLIINFIQTCDHTLQLCL